MSDLEKAPQEPTNGDVMIAIETLRNAGAKIQSTDSGFVLIELRIEVAYE